MNKQSEKIQDTLSYYGINSEQPYYISTGNALSSFPEKAFRVDYYMFCICTAGSIDLEINTHRVHIQQHTFCVAAPSTIVKFINAGTDFRMQVLFFDKQFLLKGFADPYLMDKLELFNTGMYRIFKGEQDDCRNWLMLLNFLQQKTSASKYQAALIRTGIYYLILEATEIYLKGSDVGPGELNEQTYVTYINFVTLIKQYIPEEKSVSFYAGELNISPKYLIQVVKKYSGKTPAELIDEALVQEAYLLMANSRNNIAEISFQLNFSSPAAFTRFFKANVGYSPREYRSMGNIELVNLG